MMKIFICCSLTVDMVHLQASQPKETKRLAVTYNIIFTLIIQYMFLTTQKLQH